MAALSGKKSLAKRAKRKALVSRVTSHAVRLFSALAVGLVKVWHRNHAFIISESDLVGLTIDQLNEWVNEKEIQSLD